MRTKLLWLVLAVVVLSWPLAGSAAPGPKDKAPTEKELKEFATKVANALIKKDIDGLLDMCEAPFHRPGGYFLKDKDELRRWVTKVLPEGSYREGVNEVKKIETFKAAKEHLMEWQIQCYKEVLADGDFVIYVEMERMGLNLRQEMPLLIKVKGGKPRVVGWGIPPIRDKR